MWLQHKNYNWQTITYLVIKQDIEQYFIPADSSFHACTQWAQHKHTGNLHSYITAFTRLALKVPDLNKAEKLDKLFHSLKPAVFERVILQDPCSFWATEKLATYTSTSLEFAAK